MAVTESVTTLPFVYSDGGKMGAAMRHNPIGHYQVPVETNRAGVVKTDVECPYCHERMVTPRDGVSVSRVLREVSRDENGIVVMVENVPATHRALVCFGCRSSFTTLKKP